MQRPSFFTPDFAAAICDRIALGRSLRSVCEDEDMPSRESVRRWLRDHEDFRAQYAQAGHDRTYAMLEDMLAIADDRSIDWQDRKVMIATRQWMMGKVDPKKYGDRVEVAGDPEQPLIVADPADLARRVAFMLASAAPTREAADARAPLDAD